MANKNVELIVSNYNTATKRIFGVTARETFNSVADALTAAFGKCEPGSCVIIRPLYNEMAEGKEFFREWRSMNGEHFKEARWYI